MEHTGSSVPRVHVVGRKNAGKTTLVCDLVQAFRSRGISVATIKHTHHQHELDTPGKDSHRHREAGAAGVGIVTPGVTAAFLPADRNASDDHYQRLEAVFADCDLILVEGDLHTDAPRFEVWRSVVDAAYATNDANINAVISDEVPDVKCRVYPRSDLTAAVEAILRSADVEPE